METVLLYILGIVVIVLGLAISIALHEAGHLFFAKKFGVKVGQYMIGFGPTLFSRKRGETEYGLKAIPLGGYISMAGMYPPEKSDRRGRIAEPAAARPATTGLFNTLIQDAPADDAELEGEENRVFYRLTWWKRIIIMLGGPVMNVLIAVVLYAVVLCVFGVPGASTTIGSVSKCVATVSTSTATPDCSGKPAAPAAAAGIKPRDRIVSIDGTTISSWTTASAIIRRSAGRELTIVVDRAGTNQTVHVTPVRNQLEETDATGKAVLGSDGKPKYETVGFLGIASATQNQQQPVTAVLPVVWTNITSVGNIIIHLPQRLYQVGEAAFGGAKRDANGPISVVGAGEIAGQVASLDAPVVDRLETLLQLIAELNVALFVFNLVPLLPLDGGHVIGAVWEAVRRRVARIFHRPDPGPFDISRLVPLTMVVVAILGLSSALLIYADIVNPVKLF